MDTSSIRCARCGEPWYVSSLHTEFNAIERLRFSRGEGCPACDFGTLCVKCEGTGKVRNYSSCPPDACPLCRGSRGFMIWREWRIDLKDGEGWFMGYSSFKIAIPSPKIIKSYGMEFRSDGRAEIARCVCPDCASWVPTCPQCGGTGKSDIPLDYLDEHCFDLVDNSW